MRAGAGAGDTVGPGGRPVGTLQLGSKPVPRFHAEFVGQQPRTRWKARTASAIQANLGQSRRLSHMNSYPGLVRIKDRVVYEVGGYQRYGFVEALRHHDGR